ncbi:MAG: lyase family protein, partial [Chitinophagales bacterium]
MKLWNKDNTETSKLIEEFTVGRDKEFDLVLAVYDVQGSLAHAEMLSEVGLLSKEDWELIQKELLQILQEIREGKFKMDEAAEDIHSQIEWMLTHRIGEAGKKIHSGRSRNDQVALDIKLYLRAEISMLKEEASSLFDLLLAQSEKFKDKLFPGYTHLQVAMPSSFGLWFGAYAESLVDDLELLAAAYHVVNKNPLGSGAGYGSSFPLNRT